MTKRPHHRTLAVQLHDWSDQQLATLFELRPDLCHHDAPSSLDVVGQRAQDQASIVRSVKTVTMAENQVLQVIVCLRADAPIADLAEMLPAGATIDDIEPVLQQLEAKALVWRHGTRIHGSGELVQAMPTKFGLPLRQLIEAQTVDYLKHAIQNVRAAAPTSRFDLPDRAGRPGGKAPVKAELIDELEALLTVPGLVEVLVDSLPPRAAEMARALTTGRPFRHLTIDLYYTSYASYGGRTNHYATYPEYQLYERGLFLPFQGIGYLPREVGLALVGGKPVSDLRLTPPELVTGSAQADPVDQHAGAAAASALHHLADLVTGFAVAPAKALKSGGLGVTVMKQVAAKLEVDVEAANLLTELAHLSGLLVEHTVSRKERRQLVFEVSVGASAAAEAWVTRDSAVQWRQLAAGWLNAEYWPSATGRKDPDVKSPAVLAGYHTHGAAALRRSVLGVLAELGPGQATSREALVEVAYWRRPYAFSDAFEFDPATCIDWIYGEAETLGIVVDGTLSSIGRALLDGDKTATEQALAACLPDAGRAFTIQADLTATAVGVLERSVLVELRLLADIESTGAATTFRFSEMSLRRALDAGREANQILDFLGQHATKGVPKALTFLVNDVARRHGHLRVGAAVAFVVSEDPAVIADAVSHRKTKKLNLRLISPTVAVSAVTPDKVMTGLRDAGFFPAHDGDPTAEITLAHPTAFVGIDELAVPRHRGPSAGDGELPQPFAAVSMLPQYRGVAPIDPVTALKAAKQVRSGQPASPAKPARPGTPSRSTGYEQGTLSSGTSNEASLFAALGLDAPDAGFGDEGDDDDWFTALPSDRAALAELLEDAVADQLVLGLTLIDLIDNDELEPTLFFPIVWQPPQVQGMDLLSGTEVTIDIDDIVGAIVLGSARDLQAQSLRGSKKKGRR